MKYELKIIQKFTDKYTNEKLEIGDTLVIEEKARCDDLVTRGLVELIKPKKPKKSDGDTE